MMPSGLRFPIAGLVGTNASNKKNEMEEVNKFRKKRLSGGSINCESLMYKLVSSLETQHP